jgi:hypothetical protein
VAVAFKHAAVTKSTTSTATSCFTFVVSLPQGLEHFKKIPAIRIVLPEIGA